MAIDQEWQGWINDNLARGCDPKGIAEILLEKGFAEAAVRNAMGDAFPEAMAELPPDHHDKLARVRLTRKHAPGLRREPTEACQLYIWNEFLTGEECDTLAELAVSKVRPSAITTPSEDPFFRTSSTSHLAQMDHPIVSTIDEKIANALGVGLGYSEAIQAQKYEVDQEFKAHTDYFEPGTPEFAANAGPRGQRTWTFMIYLNTTPKGGATHFVHVGRKVKPKRGRAVIWNNLHPDGSVNPNTKHHGMPVEEGRKVIITKWFRDRGHGPMLLD